MTLSKTCSIGNGSWCDIHKVFQAPELFGVAEAKLDLETQAVIVNQFVISQFKVAAEKTMLDR